MPVTMIAVGIGEVLFDKFEDGTDALGGAPLNAAVHAHQLASPLGLGEGVMVSAVGADKNGERVLEELCGRGMSTRYIQTDPRRPTGLVSVFMRNGQPGYQISTDAAWDFIEYDDALDELAARCDGVFFGSLAQRSPVSRKTIRRFLERAPQALRMYDVNLRRNTLTGEEGYSAEIIDTSCRLASLIKMNAAELIEICALLGLERTGEESEAGLRRRMEALLARYPVEAVVLTRDARGTLLFTRAGEYTAAALPVPPEQAHPVGAGDACAAGILFALLMGWKRPQAVDLANRMGAWVASQLPGTPPLPAAILDFVRENNGG
ncbi:MAG: PfkB family carbohydrate kinase [Rhodospirillales bacterium]